MAKFTWDRERAILDHLIEAEERCGVVHHVRAPDIAEAVGYALPAVVIGLRRLHQANLIEALDTWGEDAGQGFTVTRVTPTA